MTFADLGRKSGESELAYIKRVGEAKEAGLINMTWAELADIFNKNLRKNGECYNESTYRKKYASMRQFNEEFNYDAGSTNNIDELKQLKEEIQKEKRKLFDQRREYNKMLAYDARADHLYDYMEKSVERMNKNYPLLTVDDYHTKGYKEAVVCFSDWHYGLVTDNIWNKYNTEICKERVRQCVTYMKRHLKDNSVATLHVVLLGDAAHGAIHVSARVKSEEDVCDQIMNVAEIMAQAIDELASVVGRVIVHSCYGNHMRTVQNKDESIHSDNMEKLIPWWLEYRLKGNSKISVEYSQYKEFTYFCIFDKYNVCCVHGDGFNFKNIGITANMLFTKLFGTSIDYTISGDKHHLEEFGQYGIESILVRSLCGCDDYAANKHLYDKPGQTMIIFNRDYGREATYHIPLDISIAEELPL